ncbi:MAG: GHKL domain-containing protein [bacterium]|nr:GHKL domain-containing protein [bacterium]
MNQKIKNSRASDRWSGKIIPPRMLLPLAAAGTIIIIISAVLEYRSRRTDYFSMMENRARVMTQTILNTAGNSFHAAEELEGEINKKLYSNLHLIERIDRFTSISDDVLDEILEVSEFDEMHIYDRDFNIQAKSFDTVEAPVSINRRVLQSVSLKTDNRPLYVLSDTVDYEKDYLVAIVEREKGGLIAGIINSERIQYFRRIFGFGQILRSFTDSEGIEYIVLENEYTKIAGFFEGYDLSSFSNDHFLIRTLEEENINSRIIAYEQGEIYEAAVAYVNEGEPLGVLRMGFSMSDLNAITSRANKRMFILIILMIVIGLVLLNFLLSYRHRQLLKKDFESLNEYTNTVLDNLESAVITVGGDGRINLINKKASGFLGSEFSKIYDKSYNILPDIFVDAIENTLQNKKPDDRPVPYVIPNREEVRWLSIRTTILKDENNSDKCILLTDDITGQVQLEEQKRINERLAAMRRLASSVAHEIRNPLNSIKLIVDLLHGSYSPIKDAEKYDKYFKTVQNEIMRINSIVEEFLRYARPPQLKTEKMDLTIFFNEIELLYKPRFIANGSKMVMNIEQNKPYEGDSAQLKQVFVNLIENAIQAREDSCTVEIMGKAENDYYNITVKDNGKGISQNDLKHVFDLYFTTKKKGSGIGLAIVHQVITRHNGTIEAESVPGKGTIFKIRLPYKWEVKISNQISGQDTKNEKQIDIIS